MNQAYRQASTRVVVVSVALLICGFLAQPTLGGPGDSLLEAYFLPRGTELAGTIGADYLSDYYYVIVPATGRLVVRLYNIELQDTEDELHLLLMRATENSVGTEYPVYVNQIAQSTNDSATPDVIDIPDLARGIYFVQVRPGRNWPDWDGASYRLKAEFTVFPPVVQDDIGDLKKYALPIVNQLPTVCTLSGDSDVDYFECHLPHNTNLTVSLATMETADDVNVEVYTAWDVMLNSATQSSKGDERLHLTDLTPGQYFIKVSGQGTRQYTLTATQEFAEATDILDEVGNDLAHAMPLLPSNPSVFCLQSYNTDRDVFSVYQTEDGPMTVDVYDTALWDDGDDLLVQILDEYGNLIARSDNATLIPEHIEVRLPRGQYFVSVLGEGNWPTFDGATYTLNVETSALDVGDAFNQALQIHAVPYASETYGYPYVGMIDSPGEVDFFQIVLKDSGFVYLEVDRMLYANVDVQLFDAHYTLLQTSANADTESEAIYVDDLEPGVYFVKVYSPGDATGQYRLTPTTGTPTSTIADDIGDGVASALPVVPYRRMNGYLWDDNTSDYFTFTLWDTPQSVRVRVNYQHIWDTGDDLKLYLYDESETVIDSSDTVRLTDELVELKDVDAGVYYVRVAPEHNWPQMDPGQYSIVVETDIGPLPSAELHIPLDVGGSPGDVIHIPVVLDNPHPEEITSMSIGVQFDPDILEPMGVTNAGLTLEQGNAQVRYARSANTISVSMENFSTIQSGDLLKLVFRIRSGVPAGSTSALTVIASTLNGAIVPAIDGSVTVAP